MIPKHLASLFWDTNLDDFQPVSHPDYTISRVLEFGDERAYAWLKTSFTVSEIARVVKHERRLSRRSANFWALVYHIPAEEVAALREPPSTQ